MIYVSVADLLEEKDVKIEYPTCHYSHHIHRNSPIESDDDCGTCDGARCDGCVRITDPACLTMSIESERLVDMLIKKNVPRDIAEDIVYDDFYKPSKSGYKLIWSEDDDIKEHNPELYNRIMTPDEEMVKYMEDHYKECSCLGELREKTKSEFKDKRDKYHIAFQIDIWFTKNKDTDYSIFKK